MKLIKNMFKTILLLIIISILMIGCGKKPSFVFDLPSIPTGGYYETAWIEPEIIISDSLFTLIRAERIDSIFIEGDPPTSELMDRSITFKIDRQFCKSQFSLINSDGMILKQIWNKDLTFGYYKVNIKPSRLDKKLYGDINILFRVDFCQTQLTQRL